MLALTACADFSIPELDGQTHGITARVDYGSRADEDHFTAFESGQVRPLAISANGKILFALNTPDSRLEVIRITDEGLRPLSSVMVGLEPVAVAARSNDEVWVSNHLSDSVSIVDTSNPARPVVKRTLLVGDEPRDLVFALDRAYVATAHRGQNTGRDPQLTTPGVGRADVWVFDPDALGNSLGGTPLAVISLFADTPRALAVSEDQKTVYAAAFASGNQTTTVVERAVTNFGGLPAPLATGAGVAAPWAGLIAKYRVGTPDGRYHWLDAVNRVWDKHVMFSLPDKDVFAIDASLAVPAVKTGATGAVSSVGTVLLNMAVNPVNGKVYVSNLESRNHVRFEGHNSSFGSGSVRGHLTESRITIVDGAKVVARHLNKHIDYSLEGTPEEAAKSLALPCGMQVSDDGRWLYVAALGSSKLGVFDTSELEEDTFTPSTDNQIAISGGGPTGLVLGQHGTRAYVMTRFDNGISVVDTLTRREVDHIRLYNPEPVSITRGRRFLYDAALSSAHGDSACASCHIFGDLDSLAWDLGDPDGVVLRNPGPFVTPPEVEGLAFKDFHPLKGPMTTQSLRGLANHGPMHWRGDRTGGNAVLASSQPDTGTFDEQAAFKHFNRAFMSLLGGQRELGAEDMQAFTDFILQLTYPPNPLRNLDNSLTPLQSQGRAMFFATTPDGQEKRADNFHNCVGCHSLDAHGNSQYGVRKPGFFGTQGFYAFDNAPQFLKVPHLRNVYQKIGMFGLGNVFGLPIDREGGRTLIAPLPPPLNDVSFQGDQIRGFGILHDGAIDTVFRFAGFTSFAFRPPEHPLPNPFGIPQDADGMQQRRAIESFVLAFESNLAPIVGQQVTLRRWNDDTVEARVALLLERARVGECEVVVRGSLALSEAGFLYLPQSATFATNRTRGRSLSEPQLRALRWLSPLTFTAVPVGSGRRMALDRDSDGVLDGDDP